MAGGLFHGGWSYQLLPDYEVCFANLCKLRDLNQSDFRRGQQNAPPDARVMALGETAN